MTASLWRGGRSVVAQEPVDMEGRAEEQVEEATDGGTEMSSTKVNIWSHELLWYAYLVMKHTVIHRHQTPQNLPGCHPKVLSLCREQAQK